MPGGLDEFNFENFFRSGSLADGGGFQETFGTRQRNPGISSGFGSLEEGDQTLSQLLSDDSGSQQREDGSLGFLELQRRFNAIVTPSLLSRKTPSPLERLIFSGGL